MTKTLLLTGALLVAATAASTAFAHDPYAKYPNDKNNGLSSYFFYRMDTNHDGLVSRDEHEAFASGMFTRADANDDDYLTYNELLAFNHRTWDDWYGNYRTRTGAYYEGDKYYPYGRNYPTDTPNEPFVANRGKTDRSWRDYDIKKSADDYNSDPRY